MVVNQSQRPRFYENQYLGAEDLTVVVEYERIQHARHALGAHTWGIAIGLQLKEKTSTAGGDQVDMYISPGYAWDGFGRPIVVLAPYKIPADLFKSIPYNAAIDGSTTPGHLVQVWLRYAETETQGPRPGFGVCDPADQFARIQESFQIEVGDRSNLFDQRDPIVIAGRTVDAAGALQAFDPDDPSIDDASIPYQTFPEDDPNALWLIPLGFVRWKPNPNPGQPGNFVKRTADDLKQSRRVRQYIGVVAEGIQAAGGIIRLRKRTVDDSTMEWSDDLVWVEGDLRVNGDAKLFGGKLDFRDSAGQDKSVPLVIQRMENNGQGGTDLQIGIGQDKKGSNRFGVGHLDTNNNVVENFVVRDDGRVGIGTATPGTGLQVATHLAVGPFSATQNIGAIDVTGKKAELSFVRQTLPSWPTNPAAGDRFVWYNPDGTACLSTEQNGDLLTVTSAGNVGIGTTGPNETLDVRGNITLGKDGKLSVPGGVEKLLIIRGTVAANGNIIAGAGFGVTKDGTGIYTITFSSPFPGPPSGSVTQILPDHGGFRGDTSGKAAFLVIDNQKARVLTTGDFFGQLVESDRDFTFVIMGPRG